MATSLVISGCSSSSSGSPTSGAGSGSKAGPAKSQTLTVWDFQYDSPQWGKALKQLDREFEQQNPGVTVKHVGQPFGNYNQIVRTALSGQTGPDVLMFLPAASGVLSYKAFLQPLNKFITPAQRKNLDGWNVVTDGYTKNGNVYAVPFGEQGVIFYYNKALFAKAGLNPKSPPTTYSALANDANKLREAGITPFGGGNKEGYGNQWWYAILAPGIITNKQAVEIGEGKLSFTSSQVTEIVQKYVSLYKNGDFGKSYLSKPMFTDGLSAFEQGKAAMFLGLPSGGDASYVEFNKALGESNVGVFQAPAVDHSRSYLPYGPQVSWAITKYAKNKQLAYKYISFLTGAHGAEVQFNVGGVFPNNSTVPSSVAASEPQQVQQVLRDIRGAKSLDVPAHTWWTVNVTEAYSREINLVLAGNTSVASALKAVQAAQQR